MYLFSAWIDYGKHSGIGIAATSFQQLQWQVCRHRAFYQEHGIRSITMTQHCGHCADGEVYTCGKAPQDHRRKRHGVSCVARCQVCKGHAVHNLDPVYGTPLTTQEVV